MTDRVVDESGAPETPLPRRVTVRPDDTPEVIAAWQRAARREDANFFREGLHPKPSD